VNERTDSDEDQVDCKQEHSEIFGDVHMSFLRQAASACTLKKNVAVQYIYAGRLKNKITSGVEATPIRQTNQADDRMLQATPEPQIGRCSLPPALKGVDSSYSNTILRNLES
jgi:hypothetical protein